MTEQMRLPGEGSPLGGKRYNAIKGVLTDFYVERKDMYRGLLMADGYPFGTVPLSPFQQYQMLQAWRDANDERYWSDPAAQAELAKFAARFGPPQPVTTLPYGAVA